jgi:hypothetical protein
MNGILQFFFDLDSPSATIVYLNKRLQSATLFGLLIWLESVTYAFLSRASRSPKEWTETWLKLRDQPIKKGVPHECCRPRSSCV